MTGILTKAVCTMVIMSTVGCATVYYKGSVEAELTPEDAQVYTKTRGCHQVMYEAINRRSSANDLYASMELSTGDEWVTYNRCRFSPGSWTRSGTIGDENETYLCRGVLSVADGSGGCEGSITVNVVK